jgi:type VI protein secretion system component VasK
MSTTVTNAPDGRKNVVMKTFIWHVLWMSLFAVLVFDIALYARENYYIEPIICVVIATIVVVWMVYWVFLDEISDACRKKAATEEKERQLHKEQQEYLQRRKKYENAWEKDQGKAQEDWRREQETIKDKILK